MAIQFSCPVCESLIRVPDHASGKRGSCPQCKAKVQVPLVQVPGQSSSSSERASPRKKRVVKQATPSNIPADDSMVNPEEFKGISTGKRKKVVKKIKKVIKKKKGGKEEVTVEEVTTAAVPVVMKDAGPPPEKEKTSSSRRRKKRSTIPPFVWPLLFGVVLLTGILYMYWRFEHGTSIEGTLSADKVNYPLMRPVYILKESFGLSSENAELIISEMEEHKPATIIAAVRESNSDLNVGYAIDVSSEQKGLKLKVSKRYGTWYKVNALDHKGLVGYIKRYRGTWDEQRQREVDKAAKSLGKQQLAAIRKDEIIQDFSTYQNRMLLNQLVGGLGYVIVARVETRPYRCLFEGDDGSLYFLLPSNLTRFQLEGRKMEDGSVPFRGIFTVKVSDIVIEGKGQALEENESKSPREEDDIPGIGGQPDEDIKGMSEQ